MDRPDAPARDLRERIRNGLGWPVFAACALLVFVALGALARHETRHQLADEASLTLAALARGESVHQWPLLASNEVVAGRAFGADALRFDEQGLHLRSNGAPIEVGVVVRSALDLVRHPLLHVDVRATPAPVLSIVVREALDAPICEGLRADDAPARERLVVDLAALQWTCAGQPSTPPSRAAMLRLRLLLPAGVEATLRDLALRPRTAIDLAKVAPRPLVAAADARAVSDAATRASNAGDLLPVWTLAFDGLRVEQVLAARDAIRRIDPGALVVIADDWPGVVARASGSSAATRAAPSRMATWIGVGLLVAALLAVRLRPPRSTRVRAAAELVGVLAAPLAFVLGSAFGDDIGAAWWVALGATIAFAASLMFGEAPPPLVAGGARRKGWLVALATVLAAAALALLLRDAGHALAWPSPARIARYLAWAAVQQVLICVVVRALAGRALHSSHAALLVAATAFALLHTPNAMLMQLTFVGGMLWVWNWQRHRALLANIVAHAASGLLLAAALPDDWLRSAEVGARYFLF